MKKTVMKLLAGALSIALSAGMVTVPEAQAAGKVSLSSRKLSVAVGKSKKLKLKNNKKKVGWKIISGKKCIQLKAKKKTGVTIVAKKKGTAKVQAKAGKKKYVCKVTVKEAKKPTVPSKDTAKPVNTKTPKEPLPSIAPTAPAASAAPLASATPAASATPKVSAVPKDSAAPAVSGTPAASMPPVESQAPLSEDAQVLQQFVTALRAEGATVSEDILGSDQYEWENGRLIYITWSAVDENGEATGIQIVGDLILPAFASLEGIELVGTGISSLNCTACTSLEYLDCSDCMQLASLDVTGCEYLSRDMVVVDNVPNLKIVGWGSINPEEKKKLETLIQRILADGVQPDKDSEITEADISDSESAVCYQWDEINGHLTGIFLPDVGLKGSYSFHDFPYLEELDISNELEEETDEVINVLDVSGCPRLKDLACYGNRIAELDLSKCGDLESLDCSGNNLKALDLSANGNLESLDCSDNNLTSLNLAGCSALETLICYGNLLETLEVKDCVLLKELSCEDNSLSTLDLSTCSHLNIADTDKFICDDGVDIIEPKDASGGDDFDF